MNGSWSPLDAGWVKALRHLSERVSYRPLPRVEPPKTPADWLTRQMPPTPTLSPLTRRTILALNSY